MMKIQPHFHAQTSTLLLLLLAGLLPFSASYAAEPANNTSNAVPIQQKSSHLLCGLSAPSAIPVSAKGSTRPRTGAVNPSDAEILEDLQMLVRDCGFNLIRLYDAQQNSEAVLRLIKQHKL